ncbi:hypothetical protein [Herbaspirillum huttiense]|uniref:hypothetical protein n=1 Tax=Herbaspirillum huttiense TaxID=863372 RepID=UPI0031D842A8
MREFMREFMRQFGRGFARQFTPVFERKKTRHSLRRTALLLRASMIRRADFRMPAAP